MLITRCFKKSYGLPQKTNDIASLEIQIIVKTEVFASLETQIFLKTTVFAILEAQIMVKTIYLHPSRFKS
jgi:hypothetical protein